MNKVCLEGVPPYDLDVVLPFTTMVCMPNALFDSITLKIKIFYAIYLMLLMRSVCNNLG